VNNLLLVDAHASADADNGNYHHAASAASDVQEYAGVCDITRANLYSFLLPHADAKVVLTGSLKPTAGRRAKCRTGENEGASAATRRHMHLAVLGVVDVHRLSVDVRVERLTERGGCER
jgi:hypothetical protein